MFNWKKNDSQNTQFVEFLMNILIICNFCKNCNYIRYMQWQYHGSWLFSRGNWNNAAVHYVEAKFENILEMKYWSQKPKHLWVNMQIQPVPSVTTKQMINVTISFEIQLLKVSYLHIKKRKINLQLYSWLNCKNYQRMSITAVP